MADIRAPLGCTRLPAGRKGSSCQSKTSVPSLLAMNDPRGLTLSPVTGLRPVCEPVPTGNQVFVSRTTIDPSSLPIRRNRPPEQTHSCSVDHVRYAA